MLSSIDTVGMQLLDETVKLLHVIASVQAGNRINTRMHYVYRNVWYARVMRTLMYTENREHTVGYVRTTLDNLSAIVSRVMTQGWDLPAEIHDGLLRSTGAARCGIAQLAQTYTDDVACTATLGCFSTRLGVLHACLSSKPQPQPTTGDR